MKYKLNQVKCPSCGGNIEIDIQGKRAVFCPFCGSQLAVDDGERVYTKNVNIHKNVNVHKTYTDDAAIERERRLDRENAREHKSSAWAWIVLILLLVGCMGYYGFLSMKKNMDNKKNIEAGMIKVGQSSDDMVKKNYQAVKEQLSSAGFKDISIVDLNDGGWLINKKDTVESVTIGGDGSFSSDDFFNPNDKVVITHH